MSNILTDIMGFLKRKKYETDPKDHDVLVIGVHDKPDMTGIASPIPPKDARLITVKDLRDPCERVNWPLEGSEAGVFLGKEIIPAEDPTQESSCYYAFRRLKSLNLNLTIVENGPHVEFDTTAEENQAENVGTGQGIFKDKTGEILNFRTLTSSNGSVTITESEDGNEIDLAAGDSGGAGTGTTDTVPIWTDGPSGILGDSKITQDAAATTVTINDNVDITESSLTVGYKDGFFGIPNNALIIRPVIVGSSAQGSARILFQGNAQNQDNIDAASIDTFYNATQAGQVLAFKAGNSSNNLKRMMELVGQTGEVRMLQYGNGTHTGTAAYNLSVDAAGNVIETSPSISCADLVNILNSSSTYDKFKENLIGFCNTPPPSDTK